MSVSEITETRQYLTFRLGNEIFAIDVAKVREVLDLTTITAIPRTPEFMSGVINLRGSVVPVVDLRLCFEMSKTESTRNTCIVVVEVQLDGEATVIGALADSVEEVIDLEPDQIQPAPRIGTQIRTDFIRGMGKRDAQFIMILDIDRVFSADELAAVRGPGGGSGSLAGTAGRASAPTPARLCNEHSRGPARPAATFRGSRPLFTRRRAFASARKRRRCWRGGCSSGCASCRSTPYQQYCDYLFGPEACARRKISLHRRSDHQQDRFLSRAEALRLSDAAGAAGDDGARRPDSRCWCGAPGCSSGEEPYTLAMVLSEYAETHPGFRFRILATDISTKVLERAQLAIYSTDVVEPVPAAAAAQVSACAAARSTRDRVRMVPELRRLVEFRRLNFMDADYGVDEKADAIFCRNVIIYFDRPTQEKILRKLTNHLKPGGYLFVGPLGNAARHEPAAWKRWGRRCTGGRDGRG